MGDSFHDSIRRFFTCRILCSQQSHSWACGRVGWLSDCGDPLMRTQKQLVFYESILEVLQEPGCPFCRFLKEYQAARLQNRAEKETHRLCNFHTWGLAAVQNALTAAQIFIKLVDEPEPISKEFTACDICNQIVAEEGRRIREFVSCIYRTDVSNWLRTNSALCIPHANKKTRH